MACIYGVILGVENITERAKKNKGYILQNLDIPVPLCALLHSLRIRRNLIIHLSCVEDAAQKAIRTSGF